MQNINYGQYKDKIDLKYLLYKNAYAIFNGLQRTGTQVCGPIANALIRYCLLSEIVSLIQYIKFIIFIIHLLTQKVVQLSLTHYHSLFRQKSETRNILPHKLTAFIS